MQPATAATVLGRFDGQTLRHHGQRTRFFKRGARFYVHTAGANGREADFEISHTLGVYPLQQYLVSFPDGRKQALGVAWDARTAKEGGQRWYHLYPDDPPQPGEPTHWSGREQNWNFQCAACHTTALHKGYDASRERYDTRQAELGVGCEACHGPGSAHLAWARQAPPQAGLRASGPAGLGFGQPLSALKPLPFALAPGTKIANAQGEPALGQRAGERCLGCHSRRSELLPASDPDTAYLDQYLPALATPGLYFEDGRIDGEVFEYGSFAQSAMHAAGVSCGNCHEPHSARLRASASGAAVGAGANAGASAVCSQCHRDTHAEPERAALCVSCHMPGKIYMGVHLRHDHSLRVPGAPMRPNVFMQASAALSKAEVILAVQSPQALLRLGAARALALLPPSGELQDLGARLLQDPARAVRIEAARSLSGRAELRWRADEAQALRTAQQEWLQAERQAEERPETQLNLARLYAATADPQAAERALQSATKLAPDWPPAAMALSDWLRGSGRESEGELALRRTLKLTADRPGSVAAGDIADAAQSLGLLLVRGQRLNEALPWLAQAARKRPERADYALTYTLALRESGRPREALAQARQARQLHPSDAALRQLEIQLDKQSHPASSP